MKPWPVAALLLAGASLEASPSPTPTPRPRLSGGFGRTPIAPAADRPRPLAERVRAAHARDGKEQKPAVAITNETLVTDPKKGRLTTAPARNPLPAPSPAARAPVTSVPAASSAETEWRTRARTAHQRVEELKERVAQLEAESKKLESDFYAWDDGQYRDGVIKPAWDKKREEIETFRRGLAEAEKELAELPEKARKAGALPGWIRE